jgi:hypothetical protein
MIPPTAISFTISQIATNTNSMTSTIAVSGNASATFSGDSSTSTIAQAV